MGWVHKDDGKPECDTAAWPLGKDGLYPGWYLDRCDKCDEFWFPHDLTNNGKGWLTCRYRCENDKHEWTCGYSIDVKRMGF